MNRRLALAVLAAGMGARAQSGIVEGKPGSPVRVVIYEDLQCPDCAAFRKMLDEKLLPKYGARVAFIHRDFPLAKHAWARRAAIAARVFDERGPGLGLEYRRQTMASTAQTNADNFDQRLAAFARAKGIDPADIATALRDPKYDALVEKDVQDGVARGIARTPTALVNGKPFIETFTFDEISKGIDQALAETN